MAMVDMADTSHQSIFPEFASPTQWPWTLGILVSESRRIISYHRELPDKDRPPKSIWHSYKKCAEWIENRMNPDKKAGGSFEFIENEVE